MLCTLCLVLCAALFSAAPVFATPVNVQGDFAQSDNLPSEMLLQVTPTTVTLGSSQNPATLGQSLTFTATVAPPPDGGTVTFKASGVDIAGCVARPLNAGQATCTSAALAAGVQPVTAAYSGNAAYGASTSVGLFQGVYAALQVTAGWYHTCVRKTDGTLACWGRNNEGQISVLAPNADWVQVDADGYHTCGLKADGTIACWGRNSEGENTLPTPNAGWVQVSAGFVHTCALKADGTAACWGQDDFGQITVPAPNADWVQIDRAGQGQRLPVGLGEGVDVLEEHGAMRQQPGTGLRRGVLRPLQARVADVDGEEGHAQTLVRGREFAPRPDPAGRWPQG